MSTPNWKKSIDVRMVIKEALAREPLRFNELKRKTNVSSRTLAKHLEEMEKKGEVLRTLLPDRPGVYYTLVDRKFKEMVAVVGYSIEGIFRIATEYMKTYENLTEVGTLKMAVGDVLFSILMGVTDKDQQIYLLALLLDELERVLTPLRKTPMGREATEVLNELFSNVSKLSDEEIDNLLRRIQDRIIEAEKDWVEGSENKLKNSFSEDFQ